MPSETEPQSIVCEKAKAFVSIHKNTRYGWKNGSQARARVFSIKQVRK